MGIVYNYVRLSPAKLDEMCAYPELVDPWLTDVIKVGTFLDIGKVWAGIDMLLTRVDFPVDIIFGGVGFGPADDHLECRFYTPQEVRLAAEWLAPVNIHELIADIDANDPGNQTYYVRWDYEPRVRELAEEFERLIATFTEAAGDGDAVARFQT